MSCSYTAEKISNVSTKDVGMCCYTQHGQLCKNVYTFFDVLSLFTHNFGTPIALCDLIIENRLFGEICCCCCFTFTSSENDDTLKPMQCSVFE